MLSSNGSVLAQLVQYFDTGLQEKRYSTPGMFVYTLYVYTPNHMNQGGLTYFFSSNKVSSCSKHLIRESDLHSAAAMKSRDSESS